jgi:hypothetical protein
MSLPTLWSHGVGGLALDAQSMVMAYAWSATDRMTGKVVHAYSSCYNLGHVEIGCYDTLGTRSNKAKRYMNRPFVVAAPTKGLTGSGDAFALAQIYYHEASTQAD